MADSVFSAQTNPELPDTISFVDADVLAHEDAIQRQARAALISGSAWGEFLRKVLAPGAVQPTMRLLRSSRA